MSTPTDLAADKLAPSLMAIGAHADDIELNVGGTLIKYREQGYSVVYVMSTNNMSGNWSRIDASGKRYALDPTWDVILPQRKRECREAAEFFGTEDLHLDHPQRHYRRKDGGIEKLMFGCERPDCVPPKTHTILTAYEDEASVEQLASLILDRRPEAILSHGLITGNIEHVASCLLVSAAYEAARAKGYTGTLLYWNEITSAAVGEAWQNWDTHIDVSSYWDAKMRSVLIHACQMPVVSNLEYIPWGPRCGCAYAEVFTFHTRPTQPAGLFMREILANTPEPASSPA